MPFKFNFNSEAETVEKETAESEFPSYQKEAVLLQVENKHLKSVLDAKVCEIEVGERKLRHVASQEIEEKLRQSQSKVSQALKDFSDLIPNVYEGGLKIWECSVDLANFLASEGILLEGQNVLELGCGAGLPGLFAYVSGATCCFQDFNEDVIQLVTIPNVILNTPDETENYDRSSFIAGDWSHVPAILKSFQRFDVILTSETIYNKSSQKNLLELMKSALTPKGNIYLAAKTCYFGVGGGLRQFEELLADDGTFRFRTVWKTQNGVQREILHLALK